LIALADALLIDHGALVEMRDLLAAKRQLIVYGLGGRSFAGSPRSVPPVVRVRRLADALKISSKGIDLWP